MIPVDQTRLVVDRRFRLFTWRDGQFVAVD